MTTTISKHDLQHQLQQQQQQQILLLQQQQQQLTQLQQQQRFSQNTTYSLDNTRTASLGSVATATTNRLDSITTTTIPNTIQIDTLNNNFENTFNTSLTLCVNTNNNNGDISSTPPPTKIQKKRSLLNFKSFDFHIKSLYSGLRNGSLNQNKSKSQSSNLVAVDGTSTVKIGRGSIGKVTLTAGVNANSSELNIDDHHNHHIHQTYNRIPPDLKIESVDNEESENLLIDYPQSPYSSRRNSSNDDNRSNSQLIHLIGKTNDHQHHYLQQPTPHRYEMSRSQASSPSPYYLSPHTFASSSQNIRRSSTSDIMSGSKRSASSSTTNSRRPSTSDLLRKARERRGSETRMGRSVSHGGLPRGGGSGGGGIAFRTGPGIGGRRTSMAF